MNVELLRIPAERNDVAVLYYEPKRSRGVTIVAGHGYSSSKQNLDFLCSFLAGHGFGVYSIDFPGHKLGSSGGTLRGVDDCIDALSSVVHYARSQAPGPVYAMGHSMGAMSALLTAALDSEIAGAIAIATGYGRPTALKALQSLGATDFRASYVVGVSLPDLVADIDVRYDRLLPALAGRPTLVVAATRDGMVSQASVTELFDQIPDPKTFATIDSDHTSAADHARSVVLGWLNELHPRA